MYLMSRQGDENGSSQPQLQKRNKELTEVPLIRCRTSMKFRGI